MQFLICQSVLHIVPDEAARRKRLNKCECVFQKVESLTFYTDKQELTHLASNMWPISIIRQYWPNFSPWWEICTNSRSFWNFECIVCFSCVISKLKADCRIIHNQTSSCPQGSISVIFYPSELWASPDTISSQAYRMQERKFTPNREGILQWLYSQALRCHIY